MPVVPSFSAFAPKPNLVGAVDAAKRTAIESQKTYLQGLQLLEQMRADRVKEQLQAWDLRLRANLEAEQAAEKRAELDLQKAYNTQRINLSTKQMYSEQAMQSERLQAQKDAAAAEAARKIDRMNAYRAAYADNVQKYGPAEGAARTLAEFPDMGAASAAVSALNRGNSTEPPALVTRTDQYGNPYFYTGNTWSQIRPKNTQEDAMVKLITSRQLQDTQRRIDELSRTFEDPMKFEEYSSMVSPDEVKVKRAELQNLKEQYDDISEQAGGRRIYGTKPASDSIGAPAPEPGAGAAAPAGTNTTRIGRYTVTY